MKPFFCFYGGKWRAAPRYPVPAHGCIVEPFAGAAGYATRYADRAVTLVERDPVIASLWRFLIGSSPADIMRLPLLQPGQTVDDLAVCEDARSLIGFWLNKGSATPKRSPRSWMRAGIRPKSFWGVEIRERVASQVGRIAHWKIIEGDFALAPDIDSTWFVDPPYQGHVGRRYRYSAVDYAALAAWVATRRGRVIVCENEGATWLPFRFHALSKANESRHGHKVSSEAIYFRDDETGASVQDVPDRATA